MAMKHARWMMVLVAAACGRGADAPAPQPSPATGIRRPPVLRLTYSIDGDAAAAAQAAVVMQRRFDRLEQIAAISGVTARADGERILVETPELDPELLWRVREVAARVGRLTVHVVDDAAAPMRELADQLERDAAAQADGLTVVLDQWNGAASGTVHAMPYLVAADREAEVSEHEARALGCWHVDRPVRDGRMRCRVTGRKVIEHHVRALEQSGRFTFPADRTLHFESEERNRWRTYYTERTDQLAGLVITAADARDGQREAQTWVTFDAAGARRIGDLTRAHVGHKIALVLDDRVLSAPIIAGAITGGTLALTSAESRRDAEDLAIVLESGPLPSAVREESALPL
jgi:preprotein translocase subunit SecD